MVTGINVRLTNPPRLGYHDVSPAKLHDLLTKTSGVLPPRLTVYDGCMDGTRPRLSAWLPSSLSPLHPLSLTILAHCKIGERSMACMLRGYVLLNLPAVSTLSVWGWMMMMGPIDLST